MWYFELLPSGVLMSHFATNNPLNPQNYTITEDHSQMPLNFLLRSRHFEDKTDVEEVCCVGEFIVTLIRGYSILVDSEHQGFKPYLHRLYNDGKRVRVKYNNCDLNNIDILLNVAVDANTNSDFINQAFKPGFFRDILIYAGMGWNFMNISKINDELVKIVKLNGHEDSDFRPNQEFGRFKAVANNKAIGGYNARHGSKYKNGPKYKEVPMTLEEASIYIKAYLNAVLKKYYDFKLPVIWEKDDDLGDFSWNSD